MILSVSQRDLGGMFGDLLGPSEHEKSMLMCSSLHSEFMALRYEKGADLRMEFDRVRKKYENHFPSTVY